MQALQRMLAMRGYMRAKSINGAPDDSFATRVGMTPEAMDEMYKVMALADYEDRFVIPTSHRAHAEEAYDIRGGCGFTDGNGCSTGISKGNLFGGKKRPLRMPDEVK